MRIRALATAVAAVLITACHRAPAIAPAPVHHFAVLIERSATGWAAHCETGCAWTDVTETCRACDIRLDVTGISRGYPARPGTQGFEFVVSGDHQGWVARAVRGVTWVTVSWGCPTGSCRARVDETGVHRA